MKKEKITQYFSYSLNGVTLCLIRDIRYKDNKESCPLKWRVTCKRKVVYYSTGISLLPEAWNALEVSRKPTIKEHRDSLQRYYDEVLKRNVKELAETDNFNFDILNVRLNHAIINTVNSAFDAKIKELKDSGHIGNSTVYEFIKTALEAYAGQNIQFSTITPKWLLSYQREMERKNISYATMGMRFRTLRAIFNDAIRKDLIKQSMYPFGKGRFEIPTGSGREMALSIDDICEIAAYKCQTDTQTMCRDLWLFSFYCNGINFGDMCRLKYDNIEQNEIYFYRKKTFNKTKDKKEIIAPILKPMQDIIDRWGNQNADKDSFIFPFCNGCTTEEQMRHAIHNIIRLTNKQIKTVSKALKLPDISTYSARHSYATILAKKRVPESYIAEALGHANRTVTQNYFDSYTKEERIQYNSMLL
jgi:integrase